MLRESDFFEHESGAVLLRRNFGFLNDSESELQKIIDRVEKWHALLGVDEDFMLSAELETVEDPEFIFLKDAERTFSHDKYRKKLIRVLTHLKEKFGDYQQNLSFVVSFMLLTLSEQKTIAIMTAVHDNPRFLPGHWEQEAIGAKTDAFLFIKLLNETPEFAEVASHLKKHSVPEDFLKKWFSGLGVHVLSLESLFDYFENFFEEGFIFMPKFAFSFFRTLKDEILRGSSTEELLNIFELNMGHKFSFGLPESSESKTEDLEHRPHHPVNQISQAVVKHAQTGDFSFLDDLDIAALRKEVYVEKIEKPLQAANQYILDNPIDEIPTCAICKDGFLELKCEQCASIICEECHEDAPASSDTKGAHLSSHTVTEHEEESEEEDELDELAEKVYKLEI